MFRRPVLVAAIISFVLAGATLFMVAPGEWAVPTAIFLFVVAAMSVIVATGSRLWGGREP